LGLSGLRVRLDELDRTVGHAEARAPAPPDGAERAQPITATREGELWTIEGHGERCRLKDSRGVRMLAQLLAAPGEERHVLDLSGGEIVDAGDAGEVLDPEARRAYGARVAELREELAEAEARNDVGRAARLTEELDALSDQLSAAVGLGGRARKSGSAVERARVNVQRRITDALKRVEAAAPRLGRALTATVKTGVYCVYRPLE
jgi:hypothetical protein